MAFKVQDLMTKIVSGAGPRLWACPDDSNGNDHGDCPDDTRSQGCPDDSRHCPDNSRHCPDDSNIPPNCPDDSRVQCPDDSNSPTHGLGGTPGYRAASRGGEALALLQRQLRERLDSAPEARI